MEDQTADRCVVCRTDYRDASERIASRLLCTRGYREACHGRT